MKRRYLSLLGLTLTSAIALSASAADIGTSGGYKDVAYVPLNWTGFYFGANIGGASSDMHVKDVDNLNGGASYTLSNSGVLGGGQMGYNWQKGYFVYGLEMDLGWLGISGTKFDPNFPGGTFSGLDNGFHADLTARLGFTFDQALVYAKGGYAFYNGQAYINNTAGGFGGGPNFTGSWDGWTIGGGLEYLITPVWSIKAEYQHFDFGKQDAVLITPANGNFRYSNSLTADAVTVGVNFHIPPAPTSLK